MLGKDFTICEEMAILATEISGPLGGSRGGTGWDWERVERWYAGVAMKTPDPELLSRVRDRMEEKRTSSCLLSLEAPKDEAKL